VAAPTAGQQQQHRRSSSNASTPQLLLTLDSGGSQGALTQGMTLQQQSLLPTLQPQQQPASAAAAAAATDTAHTSGTGSEPLLATQPLAAGSGGAVQAAASAGACTQLMQTEELHAPSVTTTEEVVDMEVDGAEHPGQMPAAAEAVGVAPARARHTSSDSSCLPTQVLEGGHHAGTAAAAGGSSSLLETEAMELDDGSGAAAEGGGDEDQQTEQQQQQDISQPPPAPAPAAATPPPPAAAPPRAAAAAPRPARSRPDSVLLRLVDDFLAISTSRAAAGAAASKLLAGFPGFNVAINPEKTQVSGWAVGGCGLAPPVVRA
jgi:hypothetical protein